MFIFAWEIKIDPYTLSKFDVTKYFYGREKYNFENEFL